MSDPDDMLRELRSRDRSLVDSLDRLPSSALGSRTSFLGVTVSGGSYPTVASRVYLMSERQTAVNDTENATPTYSSASYANVPAINLGSAVPTVGSGPYVVRLGPDGRWYFRA